MRRNQSRQKQFSISQKVKRRFRYSPSFEAQKCYSKIPLRYNYTSNNLKTNQVNQNQINCDYSNVRQKNLQTNQCNDTSSWVAKLVNGIQELDQENKNLQKLSQIENRSVSDLPQDSQDYGYNQFLVADGQNLFTSKNLQIVCGQRKLPQQSRATKPAKKSIKEVMIEIQLKQNKQGLKDPPVTRLGSFSKIQSNQNIIPNKKVKSKIQLQNQTPNVPPKSELKRASNAKTIEREKQKNTFAQKPRTSKINRAKTLPKFTEKSFQVSNLHQSQHQQYQQKNTLSSDNSAIWQKTYKKNSLINLNNKDHRGNKTRSQNEDLVTRKNSFISKEQFSASKQQFQIVKEHSKNLNMKDLFPEQSDPVDKSKNDLEILYVKGQVKKKAGGIKKNLKRIQDTINIRLSPHQSFQKVNAILGETNFKYCNLQSKRGPSDFTLCRKNSEQRILIDLDQNGASSFGERNFGAKGQTDRQQITSKRGQVPARSQGVISCTKDVRMGHRKMWIQEQNKERILGLFDKIKLGQDKQILSRSNLRLRGLSEQQKTELGSIITKIHYQNAEYDFPAFLKQFQKVNVQCTIKGCLSHQKLRMKTGQTPHNKQSFLQKLQDAELLLKRHDIEEKDQSFDQMQTFCPIQTTNRNSDNRKRRNSQTVKEGSSRQIQTTQSLRQKSVNQRGSNSRIALKNQLKDTKLHQDELRVDISQINNQNICRDPYVQGASLAQIQINNDSVQSLRKYSIPTANPLKNNVIKYQNNTSSPSPKLNGSRCLIQRLNDKLTSYIDKNHIQSTYRQFNLNFSQLKKHIR